MNKSESIANLAKALSQAQGEMGGAVKDKANPFFKSVYADLSSVIEAVRGPLSKHGLSFIQATEPSDKQEICIITLLMHESGEWIDSNLAVPVSKNDAQGFGSAITYAKRYGLQAMLGLPSEDDDGNAASATRGKGQPVKAALQGVQLPEDKITFLKGLAADLVESVEVAGDSFTAFGQFSDANLNSDEKIYLWDLLKPNTKTRAALKEEGAKHTKKEPS